MHVKDLVSHYKDTLHHSITPDREEICSSSTRISHEAVILILNWWSVASGWTSRAAPSHAETPWAIFHSMQTRKTSRQIQQSTKKDESGWCYTVAHTQTSGKGENRRQMLLNSFGENIRELNEQTVRKLTAGEIGFSLGQAPLQDGGIVFHH